MKTMFFVFALMLAIAILPAPTLAKKEEAEPPPLLPPQEACQDDVPKFCKNIKYGHGKVLDCLWDHYKDISENCYNSIGNIYPRADNGGAPPSHGNNEEE